MIGEIAAQGDAPEVETAEGRYGEAITLASELDMHPLVARCHHGLGALHRRIGQEETAREHIASATAMYREMGMEFWLEKIESASG